MELDKRNTLIARETGLTVGEVGTYLAQFTVQTDGSWLVHFGFEADQSPDVARKLPADKIVVVSKETVDSYERGNG
uniref:hypothetical protein n=1 Tax=Pseudomonas laurentiana TaxID=2364649 RepID=UPI0029C736B5|nr:hypothetical protein [Pseudomonas laurentiana]